MKATWEDRTWGDRAILIADGDRTFRRSAAKALAATGLRVQEAACGREVLDAALDPDVALVLLEAVSSTSTATRCAAGSGTGAGSAADPVRLTGPNGDVRSSRRPPRRRRRLSHEAGAPDSSSPGFDVSSNARGAGAEGHLGAHGPRDRGADPADARARSGRDRRRALDQPEDGRDARRAHLLEAERARPRAGGGEGPPAGAGSRAVVVLETELAAGDDDGPAAARHPLDRAIPPVRPREER